MSIALGPQGYASPPPLQPEIPPATIQIIVAPPDPQPALEVTASDAQDASDEPKEDGREKDKAADPHGPRRGRLLDIKG